MSNPQPWTPHATNTERNYDHNDHAPLSGFVRIVPCTHTHTRIHRCIHTCLVLPTYLHTNIGAFSIDFLMLFHASKAIKSDMEVSWNRGTPSHHPFLDGIFHYKPSSYGDAPIDGNLHMDWWLPTGSSDDLELARALLAFELLCKANMSMRKLDSYT